MASKTKSFSPTKALSKGWELFKKNVTLILTTVIVYFVIAVVLGKLQEGTDNQLIVVLLQIINMFLTLGLFIFFIKVHDKKKPAVTDLFKGTPFLVNYIIASLCTAVLVIIGLILLIVPGIIVALRLCLFPFYLVDKKSSAFEAMQKSAKATKGFEWPLFVLAVLMFILNIIGMIPVGLGLLITMPVSYLASVSVFRTLQK